MQPKKILECFKKLYCHLVLYVVGRCDVFLLLVPQAFVNQFIFIWGHEQCTGTLGQLTA
jgi:hypothetical protein